VARNEVVVVDSSVVVGRLGVVVTEGFDVGYTPQAGVYAGMGQSVDEPVNEPELS
jgi:hypothetical protein